MSAEKVVHCAAGYSYVKYFAGIISYSYVKYFLSYSYVKYFPRYSYVKFLTRQEQSSKGLQRCVPVRDHLGGLLNLLERFGA